jgi:hypothetical protein
LQELAQTQDLQLKICFARTSPSPRFAAQDLFCAKQNWLHSESCYPKGSEMKALENNRRDIATTTYLGFSN